MTSSSATGKVTSHVRTLYRFIAYTLPFIPILILVILAVQNGVNVPVGDQWDSEIAIFIKMKQADLSLADLLAQHNESRFFFPRLIWILFSLLPAWDFRFDLALPIICACCSSFLVYVLSRQTPISDGETRALSMFMANLLIFGLPQYQNWLWGTQFVILVPAVCLTGGLVICGSEASFAVKSMSCALICAISMFSFANGMLCWFLLLPPLLQDVKTFNRNVLTWLALYFLAMVSLFLVYFWDYAKPGYHPSLLTAFLVPAKAGKYFLAFLGAGFSDWIPVHEIEASIIAGIFLLALLALVTGCLCLLAREKRVWKQSMPWLVLAAYSLISAVVITVGRCGMGIDQALSSRYVSFSIYLPIALIFLIQIVVASWKEKRGSYEGFIRAAQYALCAIMLLGALPSYLENPEIMKKLMREHAAARTAVTLMKILPPRDHLQSLSIDRDQLDEKVRFLISSGYWRIPIVASKDLSRIEDTRERSCSGPGHLDTVEINSKGTCTARGWATLPSRREAPDAVILAYTNREGKPTALDYSVGPFSPRPDAATAFGKRLQGRCEYFAWEHRFSPQNAPQGPVEISAWAFDSESGKAFRLSNTITIRNSKRDSRLTGAYRLL